MDDLPTPASLGNNPISPAQPAGGQLGSISVGKELEPAAGSLEQATFKDVSSAKEIELPKEVVASGVTTQPITVQLPQAVTQMGVKSVGQAVMPQAPAVALPLTETQIAQGLKQSITSSWRWLAEWCMRKLKQLQKKVRA